LVSIQDISLKLVLALQSLSPIFVGPCATIVVVRLVGFFVLLIPILYWAVDKKVSLNTLLGMLLASFTCLFFRWHGLRVTVTRL
jgi:hypothetical protein